MILNNRSFPLIRMPPSGRPAEQNSTTSQPPPPDTTVLSPGPKLKDEYYTPTPRSGKKLSFFLSVWCMCVYIGHRNIVDITITKRVVNKIVGQLFFCFSHACHSIPYMVKRNLMLVVLMENHKQRLEFCYLLSVL